MALEELGGKLERMNAALANIGEAIAWTDSKGSLQWCNTTFCQLTGVRQEEVLKGLEGMIEIEGRSQDGRSRLTLEFRVGQNMDRALLLVANRLDRVTGYPAEVDEPTLRTAGAEDQSIAWFVLRRIDGNDNAAMPRAGPG
mgnify:CR=1 FL=1